MRLASGEHAEQASRCHQNDRAKHEADEAEGGRAAEQAKEHDEAAGGGPARQEDRAQDVIGQANGEDADDDQDDSADDFSRQQEPEAPSAPRRAWRRPVESANTPPSPRPR